jgi:hypothetical protein
MRVRHCVLAGLDIQRRPPAGCGSLCALCLTCTSVVVVTEAAGGGLSRWRTFGERAI